MRAFTTVTFALLGATGMLTGSADAQAVCRAADSLGSKFLAHIARHSAAKNPTDALVRDSLRLGAVSSPSQVVMVTQEAVCKKAKAAYETEFSGRGGSSPSGRLYVVKAGSTYAVLDPNYHYNPSRPRWIIMIMDDRYRKLSLF
jgi:hypothetical protein